MGRYIGLVLVTLLTLVLSGCSASTLTSTTSPQEWITPGGLAYAWYSWPVVSGNGFYNFNILLTIDVDPGIQSYYYWAHQFSFKNGDIGYMGLQTNGIIQGSWVGKMAIFSIWNALGAESGPGASCERFSGEGEGWSCRIKYNWVKGRTYLLKIWDFPSENPEEDKWWGAWVIDTFTGQETFIGKIKVPDYWQGLDNSAGVWVEYYGQVNGCNSIPYAEARFEEPTANNGSISPQGLDTEIGTTCSNAQVTTLGNRGVAFKTGHSQFK